MDLNIKQQWCAALRSGEYRQGQNNLKCTDGRLCCLGVLCELAVGAGVIARPRLDDANQRFLYEDAGMPDGGNGALLPPKVREWAGIEGNNPVVKTEEGQSPLSGINDKGAPFAAIADLIEESL